MSVNRVQFQKGLSLYEFIHDPLRYRERCNTALEQSNWSGGFVCPTCRDTRHSVFVRDGRRYSQCRRCRHQATVTVGTIFAETKLPLLLWFLAMYLMAQAKNIVSPLELIRYLGVNYKTDWRIKQQLMTVLEIREDCRVLSDSVEVDDASLGGENLGRPWSESESKVHFLITAQTCEQGRPLFKPLAPLRFTNENLHRWANRGMVPDDARIVSDGCTTARNCRRRCRRALEHHRRLGTAVGWVSGIQGREYRARQPENRDQRNLPFLRRLQARPSLSRRGCVPLQPPPRSVRHAPAPCHCRHSAVVEMS